MHNIENNQIYGLRYKFAESFFNDIYEKKYAVIKGNCLSTHISYVKYSSS